MTAGEPPEQADRSDRRTGDTESIPRVPAFSPTPGAPRPGPRGGPRAGEADDARFVGTAPPTTRGYFVDEEPLTFAEDELAGLRSPASAPVLSTRRALPLEEEPSTVVARYLFPTEKFRGEWKRHWIQLAKEIGIGVVATFVMGYATGWLAKHNADAMVTVAILVYAVILGWIAWQVTDWYFDRFILTNKRVMVVSGVVTRNVAMMPLLRVTDMKYVQSPLGRVLNYGTFELESAGQEQALRKINNLPNPNELYLRIVEEMYEPEAVEARLGAAAEDDIRDDGT